MPLLLLIWPILEARAEILKKFRLLFGRFEAKKNPRLSDLYLKLAFIQKALTRPSYLPNWWTKLFFWTFEIKSFLRAQIMSHMALKLFWRLKMELYVIQIEPFKMMKFQNSNSGKWFGSSLWRYDKSISRVENILKGDWI